jgi:hypothetical protein
VWDNSRFTGSDLRNASSKGSDIQAWFHALRRGGETGDEFYEFPHQQQSFHGFVLQSPVAFWNISFTSSSKVQTVHTVIRLPQGVLITGLPITHLQVILHQREVQLVRHRYFIIKSNFSMNPALYSQ